MCGSSKMLFKARRGKLSDFNNMNEREGANRDGPILVDLYCPHVRVRGVWIHVRLPACHVPGRVRQRKKHRNAADPAMELV